MVTALVMIGERGFLPRHRSSQGVSAIRKTIEGHEGVEPNRSPWHSEHMQISEAARADLYHGLVELLGEDRAETLMTHLPRYEPADVATKSDITELKSEIGELKVGLAAVNLRLDRLFLVLVAGLVAFIAAMASVVFTVG
ncbi:MAG TPA: hypothetical protein VGC03_00970 [Acidimicrobiia bacterium]|jgi:hypothetical protein